MPPTIDRHRLLLHTGFGPPFFLPLYSPNLQQGAQQQQSQHWDLRAFEGVCAGVCMCVHVLCAAAAALQPQFFDLRVGEDVLGDYGHAGQNDEDDRQSNLEVDGIPYDAEFFADVEAGQHRAA